MSGQIKRYEIEMDDDDQVRMGVYKDGAYVTYRDHASAIAAKDEEIARLKEQLEAEREFHDAHRVVEQQLKRSGDR